MEYRTKERLFVSVFIAIGIALAALSCASLSRSAMNGNVEGIKKHLDAGENINETDGKGWTPLMWAVYYNQIDAVKYMLSRGAEVNARTQKDSGSLVIGTTPLMLSAYYGYAPMVRLLLTSGADRNARDQNGDTAAASAERYGFLEIVSLLGNEEGIKGANTPEAVKKADKKPIAKEYEGPKQILYLNDGKTITGKVISYDRSGITLKTVNGQVTVEKDTILDTAIKEE